MADTAAAKRSSKVATPKTGGGSGTSTPTHGAQHAATQPLADSLETLGKAIGARVKLTTAAPLTQTYEGTLFTACAVLNIVAVNTSTSNGNSGKGGSGGDFHIIPVSCLQSFQILSLPGEDSLLAAQPAIGHVDTKALQQRERARTEQLKDEEKHRGKGVSREAQMIYDCFKRINTPIRWHNQEMIVHEAVIIAPPYRVEDCKGPREKQEVVNRVRKVLEGERRKIREREEAGAAAPTGQQRKGG